ncbi:MAG: hypothetical protein H6Q52_77 [Deltaproteobacteria bacterium]|nr:hypothetical protein [Deltaproteobacteria bacterium]
MSAGNRVMYSSYTDYSRVIEDTRTNPIFIPSLTTYAWLCPLGFPHSSRTDSWRMSAWGNTAVTTEEVRRGRHEGRHF